MLKLTQLIKEPINIDLRHLHETPITFYASDEIIVADNSTPSFFAVDTKRTRKFLEKHKYYQIPQMILDAYPTRSITYCNDEILVYLMHKRSDLLKEVCVSVFMRNHWPGNIYSDKYYEAYEALLRMPDANLLTIL